MDHGLETKASDIRPSFKKHSSTEIIKRVSKDSLRRAHITVPREKYSKKKTRRKPLINWKSARGDRVHLEKINY